MYLHRPCRLGCKRLAACSACGFGRNWSRMPTSGQYGWHYPQHREAPREAAVQDGLKGRNQVRQTSTHSQGFRPFKTSSGAETVRIALRGTPAWVYRTLSVASRSLRPESLAIRGAASAHPLPRECPVAARPDSPDGSPICRHRCSWCSLHNARPFDTTGSPRGCPSGRMWLLQVVLHAADGKWRSARGTRAHALAERNLMQPLGDLPRDIPASNLQFLVVDGRRDRLRKSAVIHRDGERQAGRVIADDVGSPRSHVAAGHDAVKVNERDVLNHRQPQASVLMVLWVGPSVAVA